MNIRTHYHIFRRRFVYIHTFFHRKIMCSCRLVICLYDIRHASCEYGLFYIRVVPPEPIYAKFAPTISKIYPQPIRTATPVLSRATIIYRYYISGKNFILLNTHAHMGKIKSICKAGRQCCLLIYGKIWWEKCKKM